MKLLTLVMIIATVAAFVLASVPTKTLQSLDLIASDYQAGFNFVVSSKRDLLVFYESSSPAVAVRRRNAEGVYESVANITEVVALSSRTNGKWISVFKEEGVALLLLNEKNLLSNASNIPTDGGYVLSDDTFVGYYPVSELDDGNFTFRTYQHKPSNNTWTIIPGTDLSTTTTVLVTGDRTTYQVTDTHLVYADVTNMNNTVIKIHERQSDKSWKLTDSVPVNSTFNRQGNLAFNGVDTIVYTFYSVEVVPNQKGIVFVYTKVNGEWIQQTFTGQSLQLKPTGYLGITIEFSDPDTLFVGAGWEGLSAFGYLGGKVIMLGRNADGLWEHSLNLIADTGLFGVGFAINDQSTQLATTNKSATVPNLTSRSCTPPTTLNAELSLSFSRGYGSDYTCNATVTCPSPPVVQDNAQVSSAGVIPTVAIASVVVSITMLRM